MTEGTPITGPRFPPLNRREILKLISLGAGAWMFAGCTPAPDETPAAATPAEALPTTAHESATAAPETTPTPTSEIEVVGMPALPETFTAGRLTPTDDFYVQNSMGVAKPDPFEWRVNLNGLFDNPFDISLSQLKQRPAFEIVRTLECIGNPVGGTLVGNATWKGASLPGLLEEAGLQAAAGYILFLAADGYETSVRTEVAMLEGGYLAYEMNGEPLTVAHGFPARILLPGLYGQKQPKWVISIRASERDKIGTWETKGWSNTAEVQVNSRIETPKLRQMIPAGEPFYVTGIAFSDFSGIVNVEVSIDDGATWMPAELLPGDNPGVWTLWHWAWVDPQPGKYVVIARATDGSGTAQTASGAFGVLDNVFPNGTSLMHTLSVTVV